MGACCSCEQNGQSVEAIHGAEVFSVPESGFSIPVRSVRQMGWVPDLPDFRDRHLALPVHKKRDLPTSKDLRPAEHFPIYNQGHLGSCTANAIGAAYHFSQIKEGVVDFTPSRLFIYYQERAMEGNISSDSGAQIRDGVKCCATIGVCDEALWPYDESTFTERPSSECYEAALKTTVKEYARVPQTLDDLRACINEGFPFVFGFIVFSSFMTAEVAKTGKMKMPSMYDKVLGGHAIMAIGYNDETKTFIIRNSWGEDWGDAGYFHMPYDYITHPMLAQDFWTIRFVEGEALPTTVPKH